MGQAGRGGHLGQHSSSLLSCRTEPVSRLETRLPSPVKEAAGGEEEEEEVKRGIPVVRRASKESRRSPQDSVLAGEEAMLCEM